MTPQQIQQMQTAIQAALAAHPEIQKYAGSNDPATILDAYTSGDWSGVIDLTGKPFTDEQQQAAVAQAEKVLAPAYDASKAYDTSTTEDALRKNQEGFQDFQRDERKNFVADKTTLDQNAADQGVLFSGSRVQKLNDLRNTYQDRERIQRQQAADTARSTGRAFQYDYGNDAAAGLSDLYRLPGASGFNVNNPAAPVRPGGLSAAYNTGEFNFQGTKPVAQKTAVQTRAATQLANRANKLSLAGYGAKF